MNETASALDRSRPPLPGPVRPFRLPEIRRGVLANGLETIVARDASVPLASATLLVRSGSSRDPLGRAGLASLVSTLLTEGTRSFTSTELSRRVDLLGGSLHAAASNDATYVRFSSLARYFSDGLSLLGEAALAPTFPEKEFTRVRGQRLDSLKQMKDSPAVVASDRFGEILYAGTPYENPVAGGERSVASIDSNDVAAFHAANFVPGGSILVVVGDIDPDAISKRIDELFSSWKGEPLAKSPEVLPRPLERTKVFLADRPASVQSVIRIGHASVPRNHPDYFPIQVMNTILGGKFTSRVNLNLRETHGYTYGASTRFDYRLAGGPFSASADVQNPVTAEAVKELLFELDRIRESDVTELELADAISYLQGVFPYLLETADDLGSRLLDARLYGLPDDYLLTYQARVGQVGRQDVRRVAREQIDPSRLAIVVVGKAEEIQAGLEAIAPVERTEANGTNVIG